MILGRVAGSLLGAAAGPFGLAFGFLSGFLIDRVIDRVRFQEQITKTLRGELPADRDLKRNLIRLIGLGVAVSVSDGFATDSETGVIAGFVRRRYGASSAQAEHVRRILEEALVLGSRIRAEAVAAAMDLEVLNLSRAELTEYLLQVAKSRDGEIGDRRRRVLEEITTACGAPPIARALDPHACAVLGIHHDADLLEVRSVYRRLVQQFHPDGAAPLTDEQRLQSNEALVRINQAYERVSRQLQGREEQIES